MPLTCHLWPQANVPFIASHRHCLSTPGINFSLVSLFPSWPSGPRVVRAGLPSIVNCLSSRTLSDDSALFLSHLLLVLSHISSHPPTLFQSSELHHASFWLHLGILPKEEGDFDMGTQIIIPSTQGPPPSPSSDRIQRRRPTYPSHPAPS